MRLRNADVNVFERQGGLKLYGGCYGRYKVFGGCGRQGFEQNAAAFNRFKVNLRIKEDRGGGTFYGLRRVRYSVLIIDLSFVAGKTVRSDGERRTRRRPETQRMPALPTCVAASFTPCGGRNTAAVRRRVAKSVVFAGVCRKSFLACAEKS